MSGASENVENNLEVSINNVVRNFEVSINNVVKNFEGSIHNLQDQIINIENIINQVQKRGSVQEPLDINNGINLAADDSFPEEDVLDDSILATSPLSNGVLTQEEQCIEAARDDPMFGRTAPTCSLP